MSHIVEARTTIQSPDLALLRQTLEIVAGAHGGGHVEDHIGPVLRKVSWAAK